MEPITWDALSSPLTGHRIAEFKPLMTRAEQRSNRCHGGRLEGESRVTQAVSKSNGRLAGDPINDNIEFPDFAKVDLRVVRIVRAEHVDGADKLLQLTLDLGGVTRNVFAGIKSAYAPEELEETDRDGGKSGAKKNALWDLPKGWCSLPGRAAKRSSCLLRIQAPNPVCGSSKVIPEMQSLIPVILRNIIVRNWFRMG